MTKEAYFYDHCDEPGCTMGSLEYDCPCCGHSIIDYGGHYLEQYDFDWRDINCNICNNKLILFHAKDGWFVKEKITTEKFEYFLEMFGLESAYTNNPIRTRHFFEFGDGWLELVKELIEELSAVGWNKKLAQSKEKFGALRFYTSGVPEGAFEIIEKYARRSAETCELCGAPGKIIDIDRWLSARCKVHG